MNTELKNKLVAIQAGLKAPKSQYNNFGKYKYRSCEDILEAVKPLLNEHGVALTISDEVLLIGNRYYIKATATISDDTDTYSVSALAREEDTKKGMDGSQVTGASSSYARKYALNGLFAIDDTKDSDTTNYGNDAKVATPAQPTPAPTIDTLPKAIAEVNACKSSAEVSEVWKKYSCLNNNPDFVNHVRQVGKAFKAQENGNTPQ